MSPSPPHRAVPYIKRTRALYASQPPYLWVRNNSESEPPPWTPIEIELSAARVALIASGGVYRVDQEPFHFRNDTSHREIPTDTPVSTLRVSHFGYDIRDSQKDPGCVFPLEALRSLAADGVIGELVDPAFSFMGGIYSAQRVSEELAPRFREFLLRQKVDLAYLVPA